MYDTALSALKNLKKKDLIQLREHIDRALTALHKISEQRGPQARHALRLSRVPEDVRRLDRNQLEALKRSFQEWMEASRSSWIRRSRERVYLVFLMLRYTGARLGEVLTLDEHRDIDFSANMVMIPHGLHPSNGRRIPLPGEVIERIRSYCQRYGQKPTNGSEKGSLFNLDQGFVRRKFYEQEKRSGLPRELLKPSILRYSRAIELLQEGMPVRAVQSFLGHSSTDVAAAYVQHAEEDLQKIINQHCQREFGMETSARNTFYGEIIAVTSNPVMSEVILKTSSGNEIMALITNQSRKKLGLTKSKLTMAMIKATWVIIEKAQSQIANSVRNAFPGIITKVTSDGVITEVSGNLKDGTPVCALVTTESFNKLGIGKGDRFIFMFKAMSVILS